MPFDAEISSEIWNAKYRFRSDADSGDGNVEATWARIAAAIAEAEPARARRHWRTQFESALSDFKFLPAGRIIAGAGTGRSVTLFNCFVMGTIPDNLDGIFEHLREAALTMQQGGGVGMDFSTIRPAGAPVRGVGAQASGPLSFMDAWDAMCRTVMSAGQRRGAMMGCLRIDHPDIEAFIDTKRDPARLRNFNVSVLVTDAFMAALAADQDWALQFNGEVYRSVRARDLWARLMRATYDVAEPGVIFIDRVNAENNLAYCETVAATNPCGEQPLPPYGACLLGSINLSRLVQRPFEADAAIDMEALEELTATAVRLLDNVIDVSRYPLREQEDEAKSKRRIGLGVTGLADALIFCNARYGAADGVALTESWLKAIRRAAYRASAKLAAEKGVFPAYDPAILDRPTIASLDEETRALIAEHGLRNGCLTTIAPTGTISLLAGNTSSGIEPVFAFSYQRRVRQQDNSFIEEPVQDYALTLWRRLKGDATPPEHSFVSAQTLAPADHLAMQATAQRFIDSSISKTVNCPEDIPFEEFSDIYARAFDLGCKGCTTYRPNAVTGSVLSVEKPAESIAAPSAHATLAARPETLIGSTYKIKWPESEHALYVTINDLEENGVRRPFEIFINSKNMEHYAWTLALTRMVSAVFRRGGDVSFVAEELKAVFDPRGGSWLNGRYVPSLLAAIGDVIQRHLDSDTVTAPEIAPPPAAPRARPRFCPKCSAGALIRTEGCDKCLECGYSKCS
ncbi:MAG: adenosylcobalamin-dependent ribonucleoside-diphosphate reductase [Hyphomonadaceae bacterium]|jgi:ribonucleoside-diphosphate reductase alpha chain|nr:adenosylcobalamin-dependent ribonucleoside-diphosphate reductase [Hyphomonadaceae bacterium]